MLKSAAYFRFSSFLKIRKGEGNVLRLSVGDHKALKLQI